MVQAIKTLRDVVTVPAGVTKFYNPKFVLDSLEDRMYSTFLAFLEKSKNPDDAYDQTVKKYGLNKKSDRNSEKLKRLLEGHRDVAKAWLAGHDVNTVDEARRALNPPKEKRPRKESVASGGLPPDTRYSYPHLDLNGNVVFIKGKVSDPLLTSNAIPELPSNSPAPIDSLSIDSPNPTLLLDKYKDLLCENDTVYFRGRKIQGPELIKHKEYSIIDCSSHWVRAIVAEYDSSVLGIDGMQHYIKGSFTTGLKGTSGLIFRPINRLEAINGIPIDAAAVSLTLGNKFNKGFVDDLDREKGKIYQVTNKYNGKYFYGTYIGHSKTTNGNFVLWFKEGFCIEISKDTFELAPIGEDKGAVYPSSRRSNRPERKIATRVAHGELTATPQNTGRAQPTTPSNAASTSGEIKVGEKIPLNMWYGVDRLKQLSEGTKFRFKGWHSLEQKGDCTFRMLETKQDQNILNYGRESEEPDCIYVPSNNAISIEIISLPESQIPKQTDKKVTLRVGESPEGKLIIGAFYKSTQGHNTFPGSKLLDWHKEDAGSSRTFYHLVFESDQSGSVFTIPITDELTLEEVPEPKKATSLSTSTITFSSNTDEASISKLKVGQTYIVCDRQPEGHSDTFEGELKQIKRDGGVVFLDFGSAYHDVVVYPGLTLTPVGGTSVLGAGDDVPGARGITKSGHITALSLDNLPPQMDRSKSFRIGEGPDRIFTQKYYRFCMIVKGELFLTAGKILNTNQAAPEGIIVELELPDGRRDIILCRLSDFIQPIEDPKSRIVLNEKESPEGKLVKDKWYKAYDRTGKEVTGVGAQYKGFTKDVAGNYILSFDTYGKPEYRFTIPIRSPDVPYSFEEVSLNPISTDC